MLDTMPNQCASEADLTVPQIRRRSQAEISHSRDIPGPVPTPVKPRAEGVYSRLLRVMDLLRGFGGTAQECDTAGGRAVTSTRVKGSACGTLTFSVQDGVYAMRFELALGAPNTEERESYDSGNRNIMSLNSYTLTFDGAAAVQRSPVFQADETAAILDSLDCIFGPR